MVSTKKNYKQKIYIPSATKTAIKTVILFDLYLSSYCVVGNYVEYQYQYWVQNFCNFVTK